MGPTVCALPWLHQFRDSDGRYNLCCLADPASGTLWPDEGRAKARRQMLAGEKPSACRACFFLEDQGVHSERQRHNLDFRAPLEQALAATSAAGEFTGAPISADFRLGNVCNLKCRMCGPQYSSGLVKEWEDLSYPFGPLPSGWHEDEVFWQDFWEKNPQVEHLLLAGGEPFLSPRFLWLVDYLWSTGRARDIRLSFHTNLTVLPANLLPKLEMFRLVHLRVSIDGIGALNDYIRQGSKWDTLVKNLDVLHAWAKYPFTQVHLNTTVQAYNALGLASLLEFSLRYPSFLPASLNLLVDPPEFSARVLPEALRLRAAASLEALLAVVELPSAWGAGEREKFLDHVRRASAFLRGPGADDLWPRFVQRTQAQDAYRRRRLSAVLPELAAYMPVPGSAKPNPPADCYLGTMP